MPAEWAPHECCIMAWPARRSLWGAYWDEARADVAAVARAIAAFEPVLMVCAPGARGDVAAHCGSAVDVAEIPIDDSWTRDTGPIVVADGAGRRAMVAFGFNGWGGKYVPHDRDAALPEALADLLGFPLVRAPLVAEGGALLVDGEGTLVTTEGSVLNANRNPGVSAQDAEVVFRDYLGVERTIWLVAFPDRDTDGHIDGIAQYVAPGRLALQVPDDASGDVGAYARENLERLAAKPDAGGRAIEVLPLETVGAALARRRGVRDPLPQLLPRERRGDRAGRRPRIRRGGAGTHEGDLPGADRRRGPRDDPVARRRRPALHHPADPERDQS